MAAVRDMWPGCGGLYTSRSGIITSADYPHAYPPRTDCLWVIRVAPRHQVVLNFTDFDLENSTRCRFDYLAVSTHRFCDCVRSILLPTLNARNDLPVFRYVDFTSVLLLKETFNLVDRWKHPA